MRVHRHALGLPRTHRWTWIIAVWGAVGCSSPGIRDSVDVSSSLVLSADSTQIAQSPTPLANGVIAKAPWGQDTSTTVEVPSLVETWVVHTRACEQKMGSDPWSSMTIGRLDSIGGPLRGSHPETLLARMTGRPTVVLIHGYSYIYREAIEEAVKVRAQLEAVGGLTPDSLLIVFDWPSEQELSDLYSDLNDKARRSRIAGYHLARFLQESPPGSRVCLFGQSDGGRVALTSLHLLSGALLPPFFGAKSARLNSGRPDLRLRSVILATAAGHHWLNPGEQMDQAIPASEALLNLRNRHDYALALFIFGRYTGFRGAIGRVGLNSHDLRKLGPLSARVEQLDLNPAVGISHTTFTQALDIPDVAERIARYTSWSDLTTESGL